MHNFQFYISTGVLKHSSADSPADSKLLSLKSRLGNGSNGIFAKEYDGFDDRTKPMKRKLEIDEPQISVKRRLGEMPDNSSGFSDYSSKIEARQNNNGGAYGKFLDRVSETDYEPDSNVDSEGCNGGTHMDMERQPVKMSDFKQDNSLINTKSKLDLAAEVLKGVYKTVKNTQKAVMTARMDEEPVLQRKLVPTARMDEEPILQRKIVQTARMDEEPVLQRKIVQKVFDPSVVTYRGEHDDRFATSGEDECDELSTRSSVGTARMDQQPYRVKQLQQKKTPLHSYGAMRMDDESDRLQDMRSRKMPLSDYESTNRIDYEPLRRKPRLGSSMRSHQASSFDDFDSAARPNNESVRNKRQRQTKSLIQGFQGMDFSARMDQEPVRSKKVQHENLLLQNYEDENYTDEEDHNSDINFNSYSHGIKSKLKPLNVAAAKKIKATLKKPKKNGKSVDKLKKKTKPTSLKPEKRIKLTPLKIQIHQSVPSNSEGSSQESESETDDETVRKKGKQTKSKPVLKQAKSKPVLKQAKSKKSAKPAVEIKNEYQSSDSESSDDSDSSDEESSDNDSSPVVKQSKKSKKPVAKDSSSDSSGSSDDAYMPAMPPKKNPKKSKVLVKKLVNKRTGEVISEKKTRVPPKVFSRLSD